MKYPMAILLILAVLVSSCAIPQPDSSDTKPSGQKVNDNIEKPKISENTTISKKEELNDTIPQKEEPPKQEKKEDIEEKINETPKLSSNKIKIATFNIQIFGKTKREKQEVMEVLKKIVRNFDIVAIQEVRDSSETTIPFFLNEINSMSGPDYDVVYGERMGRSTSKEQYAYYFNTETVKYKPNSAYTYADANDIFEREPFIAGFSSGTFNFFLIDIHTKPEDAFNEIDKLDLVVKDAESKFADDDFIVLGDFNADCNYFNEKADSSALEGPEYYWVIEDSADTTTKSTVCTYDRIVFKKDTTLTDYVGNWGVFRFDTEYNLNQELTEDVSDHYPVWAEFYTDRDNDIATNSITANVIAEISTKVEASATEASATQENEDGDSNCESLGCSEGTQFVGSVNSDVYHQCHCSYAKRILEENLVCFVNKEEAIGKGYRAAKRC